MPGPFVTRELQTSSRRWSTYADRGASAASVLLVIGAGEVSARWLGWDRSTPAAMTRHASQTMAFVVAAQTIMAMGVVVTVSAAGVAAGRDRKTLDALLATRLTSAEVVLGVVGEALVRAASGWAVGLSLALLFAPYGGVDPRVVLLGFAGVATTAFAAASLGVAASVEARTGRQAVSAASVLVFAWALLPIVLVILLPRFWPWGARWVYPGAALALDSGPLAVALSQTALFGRPGGPVEATLRMIGLQVVVGAAVLAWAVARLRPASRAAYDGENRSLLRRLNRTRRRRRTPCGDDPVFWNEVTTSRTLGRVDLFLFRVYRVVFLSALAMGTYRVARPAFEELAARGYGPTAADAAEPGVHPTVRWLVNGWKAGPPPGQARAEFNGVLRQATAVFLVMYPIVLLSFTVESLSSERERDTWSGLLATPLTGPEVLRSKVRGAVWRTRGYLGLLAGLWGLGLLSGAVHPLGLAAATAALAAAGWFSAALGVWLGLKPVGRNARDAVVVFPTFLLPLSGLLVWLVGAGRSSVLLGAGSLPFLGWMSLLSYDDVSAAVTTGGFPALARASIRSGEGAGRALAALGLGLALPAAAAFAMTRAVFLGFDAAVGRPVRAPGRRSGVLGKLSGNGRATRFQ